MHDYANLRAAIKAGLPSIRALLNHIGDSPIGPVLLTKVLMAKRAYEDIGEELRKLDTPIGTDGKPLTAPREWWQG